MSPHSPIHFLPFNELPYPYSFSYLSMNFVHSPIYSVFLPFNHLAPIPSFIFLLFNNLSFPYSFSYFSYLLMNSNSPIHFPTFQWAPRSPIPFPTFSTFQRAPIPQSIFQLFNDLPFPHLFSYFSYLSMSSHSSIRFPTIKWAPIPHSFSYFSNLSMSSPSPIFSISFNHLPLPHFHFPTFPSRFPLFPTLPL